MREAVSGIKHPAFRDAVALTRAGGRTATGRYLVEDLELVRQALQTDTDVFAVFASYESASELEGLCASRQVPLYLLGGGLITKLLGTSYETATTAVAVVRQQTIPPLDLLRRATGLVLCGEKIQDPRNVGVLVRTAEAAGCAGLLLSSDSSEPFSRQAVRSTTGSIVRVPLALTPDLPATLTEMKARGAAILVSSGEASDLVYDADLSPRPLVIVMGNEQHGVSPAVESLADRHVRLPMARTGVDSLNVTVAAGALLYEAVRQAGELRQP